MKISNSLLSVGLLLGATSAAALSLGEVRGSVVLGRPLDVHLDVLPDAGATLDPSCLTASATLGDTRIDSSRMQISVLPAVAGRAQTVRVRSRVLVNEPILTLRLNAGCTAAVSRTYDLFADPPETLAAAALPVLPMQPVLPAERRPTADRVAASAPPPRADSPATPLRRTPTAPRRMAAAPSARIAPAVKSRKAPSPPLRSAKPVELAMEAPTSRLVVEPLEDWLLLPSALRLSTDLRVLPTQDPSPERTQAAAQWKALNTPLDDSAGQAERIAALSAQAAAARAATAQAQSAVSALQERVDRMEAERFSPTLVYALWALLAATLAGWGWSAFRSRRHAAAATAGWSGAVAASAAREGLPRRQGPVSGNADVRDEDLDIFLEGDDQVQRGRPPSAAEPTSSARLDQSVATHAPAPVPLVPHVARPLPAATGVPAVPAVHVVHPEDLFDLQQQAEFFISVGEHDQAIAVMSKHIAQNHAASPWAYLELLRLYRSLSRIGPFNQLREQFQQHFNAQVPEFAAFHQDSRHLLDYPEVLARIEALWSERAVVPLLEGLLFCSNATAPMERFDLSAYDDLLMLYAIASTTPASGRGAPPPRQRTTPVAGAEPPASLVPPALLDLDDSASLTPSPSPTSPATDNLIEYDLVLPRQGAPASVGPLDRELDIDLTEPDWKDSRRLTSLTVSDLPDAPVTAVPAPSQPVGFGANSDRVEARFDLEERKPGVR